MKEKNDIDETKIKKVEREAQQKIIDEPPVEELLKSKAAKGAPEEPEISEAGEEERYEDPAQDRPSPDEKNVRLQAISDRARKTPREDALNFTPSVLGLVSFIKSKDTEPPLAIAVNGRWGQGKTSFMQMLDSELTKKSKFCKLRGGQPRFATAWFNPWKFSEAEKVWASFVDVITRCIRTTWVFPV